MIANGEARGDTLVAVIVWREREEEESLARGRGMPCHAALHSTARTATEWIVSVRGCQERREDLKGLRRKFAEWTVNGWMGIHASCFSAKETWTQRRRRPRKGSFSKNEER